MNFTRISQKHSLFENLVFKQAPGSFQSLTDMPFTCIQAPGKKPSLAIGSSVCGWRRSCQIPASSSVLAPGQGRGSGPSSPRARFCGSAGSGKGPVRGLGGVVAQQPLELRSGVGGGTGSATNGTQRLRGAV
jgi:hypothetical protein